MRQGSPPCRPRGADVTAVFLARLAEAYGNSGQAEAGLGVLAEALAVVDTTGERREAELYRLQGELLLRRRPQTPPSRSLLPSSPCRGPPSAGQVAGSCAPP